MRTIPRHGPLAGLRIIEFAGLGPAPFAAMLLSDMGADIVCISRPGTVHPDSQDIINRNRRVITLDLKQSRDIAQARALALNADVLIEGFRPGTLERLGLGPDVILGDNPRIVYARMTGWGQSGPLAHTAGHDINYLAITGALAAIGPAAGRPAAPLNLVADYGGGALFLVAGILAALLHVKHSGKGQVVDSAMSDNVVTMLSMFHTMAARNAWKEQRESNWLDGGAPFYGTYECSDGRYIAIGALEAQFYEKLRDLVGLDDPIFDDQNNEANWPAMRSRLQEIISTRSRAEWTALAEGTDTCLTPVLTMSEARGHPQFTSRQTFTEVDGVIHASPAPRFQLTPSAISGPAMEANAEDLLSEWQANSVTSETPEN